MNWQTKKITATDPDDLKLQLQTEKAAQDIPNEVIEACVQAASAYSTEASRANRVYELTVRGKRADDESGIGDLTITLDVKPGKPRDVTPPDRKDGDKVKEPPKQK